jgi:hypothetical protein
MRAVPGDLSRSRPMRYRIKIEAAEKKILTVGIVIKILGQIARPVP